MVSADVHVWPFQQIQADDLSVCIIWMRQIIQFDASVDRSNFHLALPGNQDVTLAAIFQDVHVKVFESLNITNKSS